MYKKPCFESEPVLDFGTQKIQKLAKPKQRFCIALLFAFVSGWIFPHFYTKWAEMRKTEIKCIHFSSNKYCLMDWRNYLSLEYEKIRKSNYEIQT